MGQRTLQAQVSNLISLYRDLKRRVDIIEPRESVGHIMVFDTYTELPARNNESDIHGGLLTLVTNQPLDNVSPINISKGIGKVMISVLAGGDFTGEITITGDTIDRETGVKTVGDTDIITVDALTIDNSIVDLNGNTVHAFVGAYCSSEWFTGNVVLSTANLTLTDVDVFHLSFEQANDQRNLTLRTFDVNLFTTNASAEFDAYLHTVHVDGSKCNIDNEASLHIGAEGETAIADKYWRLRRGNINEDLDGLTDGFWVDVRYSNNPVFIEDVTMKVWVTKT